MGKGQLHPRATTKGFRKGMEGSEWPPATHLLEKLGLVALRVELGLRRGRLVVVRVGVLDRVKLFRVRRTTVS